MTWEGSYERSGYPQFRLRLACSSWRLFFQRWWEMETCMISRLVIYKRDNSAQAFSNLYTVHSTFTIPSHPPPPHPHRTHSPQPKTLAQPTHPSPPPHQRYSSPLCAAASPSQSAAPLTGPPSSAPVSSLLLSGSWIGSALPGVPCLLCRGLLGCLWGRRLLVICVCDVSIVSRSNHIRCNWAGLGSADKV